MEPLSISASIAGLLSLSGAVGGCLRSYLSSVVHAPTAIADAQRGLDLLYLALKHCQDTNSGVEDGVFPPGSRLHIETQKCSEDLKSALDTLLILESDVKKRGWQRLKWPKREKEFKKLDEKIRNYAQVFMFCVTIDGRKTLGQIVDEAQHDPLSRSPTFQKISGQIDKLLETSKKNAVLIPQIPEICSKEWEDTLNWVSQVEFLKRHTDVYKSRTQGTGRWLLKDGAFISWLYGNCDLLRCYGWPGVGKSHLAALIIEYVGKYVVSSKTTLAYTYVNYNDPNSQEQSQIIRSLFCQMASKAGPFQAIIDLYKRHRKEEFPMSEIRTLFPQITSQFERCFIIIDGFDEILQRKQREKLLSELQQLKTSNMHLLVLSRPTVDITLNSAQEVKTKIIKAHDEDIRLYCQSAIEESENMDEYLDDRMEDEITRTVVARADGMFLLAHQHMEDISSCVRKSDMLNKLQNLPVSYDDAFRKTFERILRQDEPTRNLAMEALSWVLYGQRPLKVQELRYALELNVEQHTFDENNLVSWETVKRACCGFLSTGQEDSALPCVRLYHYALQDYLSVEMSSMQLRFLTLMLAKLMRVIHRDDLSGLKDFDNWASMSSKGILVDYASQFWDIYADQLPKESQIEAVIAAIEPRSLVDANLYAVKSLPRTTPAHPTRALVPNRPTQQWLLSVSRRIDCQQTNEQSQMQKMEREAKQKLREQSFVFAASIGLTGLALHLLPEVSNVNVKSKSNHTALNYAVYYGDEELVESLLTKKAEANGSPCFGDWTNIKLAVMQCDFHIATLLLKAGAEIERRPLDFKNLKAVHGDAEEEGSRGVLVHRNLSPSIDYRSWIPEYNIVLPCGKWTALHFACHIGSLYLTEQLLLHGADPNVRGEHDVTPLHCSCTNHETSEALLRHGADPSVIDAQGRTPSDWSWSREGFKHLLIGFGEHEALRGSNPPTIDDLEKDLEKDLTEIRSNSVHESSHSALPLRDALNPFSMMEDMTNPSSSNPEEIDSDDGCSLHAPPSDTAPDNHFSSKSSPTRDTSRSLLSVKTVEGIQVFNN